MKCGRKCWNHESTTLTRSPRRPLQMKANNGTPSDLIVLAAEDYAAGTTKLLDVRCPLIAIPMFFR